MGKTKLVYGVGVNDAKKHVDSLVDGIRVVCPFYRTWKNMLRRSYSAEYQLKYPTYVGCVVAEPWLKLSEFRLWMETQDWKGKVLDKDLLIPGNKIYSPETCVFVDAITNSFIIDCGASRGAWPIGVYWHKRNQKFLASCRNSFTRKPERLGSFTCENKAHQAWKKRKHELACQLADLQDDQRVADALRIRYLQQWS